MSITLYTAPYSSASPVESALAELGVPHEKIVFDLKANDQKRPEFLRLNPNGQVPTLVVDGAPLFEAVAIMQWLGERFGVERKLWPAADSPDRLRALSWSTWAYVTFGNLLNRYIQAASPQVPAELHSAVQAKFIEGEIQKKFALLNAELQTRQYLLGADYSLVDLIVGCVVQYSGHCGLSTKNHPQLTAWLERVFKRPALTNWS